MDELRIFWKIVIDTTCAERIEDVVKKEVGVWKIDDGVWHRDRWERFKLGAQLVCAKEDDRERCSISCDEFCLHGCYLRIRDVGLKAQLTDMGVDTELLGRYPESVPVSARQFVDIKGQLYYVGRNIMLTAEFKAEADGLHSLFEFPMYRPVDGQDVLHRPIVVKEFKANGTDRRRALWHLSRNMLYFSHAYSVSDHHVLTVSQDQNVVVTQASVGYQGPPYFEFLLDSIPIRRPAIDKHEHLFDTGPIEFYVGYSPSKGGQLDGCVRRIVFDPNASCLGCTM